MYFTAWVTYAHLTLSQYTDATCIHTDATHWPYREVKQKKTTNQVEKHVMEYSDYDGLFKFLA